MTASPGAMILVLAASLSAMALEISGTVTNPDGTPRSGVTVALASGGSSATTDASGKWTLSSSVGVAGRPRRQALASHLSVVDGRLRIAWEGCDLYGRVLGNVIKRHASPSFAVRAVSSAPDTLVYSLDGKVFLRDTASSSRTGIVGVYDTGWNTSVIYGWLRDSRDGQLYRTVGIGTQVWMAQNLNYRSASGGADTVGVCYNNSTDFCAMYGRLYTWTEVMNSSGSSSSSSSEGKGICPEGWRVPIDLEFSILAAYAGESAPGTRLKSIGGWTSYGKGTDDFGFRALPGGSVYKGISRYVGDDGMWWSSMEYDTLSAKFFGLNYSIVGVNIISHLKSNGFSLRCIQGMDANKEIRGMKRIGGGSFMMGSPMTEVGRLDGETQHGVTLSPFYMDATHVTQGQYLALMGVNPSVYKTCGLNCPVEKVTWFDAVLYCNARSKAEELDTVYTYTGMTGTYANGVNALADVTTDFTKRGYRLPTEAEWEYAARGRTTTPYYWGDDTSTATVSMYAWYAANSGSPQPVATKLPNVYGLHDMAGNVWQWTNDWHGEYSMKDYSSPTGPATGSVRVSRGGGGDGRPLNMRSAYRGYGLPGDRYGNQGFRCVLSGP